MYYPNNLVDVHLVFIVIKFYFNKYAPKFMPRIDAEIDLWIV